ncbi:MAG: cysteine desulfurase NifS [Clostridia bacterium]|nr:cysteine desulfurase NifS [Clostridia bacterium]
MAIYLDNAATTLISSEVLEAMMPYLTKIYGNPSSVHSFGRESRKAVDKARSQVAKAIGASEREIYFTSCGTESDNWAIRGTAYAYAGKGKHIITDAIEHPAVLNCCRQLEKEGFQVTYLPVDGKGRVSPEAVRKAFREDTVLVSVMAGNNEVGTLQPIGEIAAAAHEKGILFHTDAVQAVGSIDIDVADMGIDMLSLSGHKLHAPKGVGALYLRKGININRLMYGGSQERGQRPGTENLASVVGLGAAVEYASQSLEDRTGKIRRLRQRLEGEILSRIPGSYRNGPDAETERLPGILNISFDGVSGESLLLCLDMRGVAVSSGSACTAGSLEPSHVLMAMGIEEKKAQASIRYSLSDQNTLSDVETAAEITADVVARLRAAIDQ